MIRRFGDSARPDKTYKMRPGAYAVLWRDDALLVTHQSAPTPEYQLPGGGIDQGESPVPALHREVYEETGWAIADPKRLGAFRRFTYMPEYDLWAEKICHIYLARPVICRGAPLEESHTAIWMPPREAMELLGNEGDRSFVSSVFG